MSRAEGQRGTAAEGTGKPTPVRMSCVVWRSARGESRGAGPHGKVQGVELGVRSAGGVVGRRRERTGSFGSCGQGVGSWSAVGAGGVMTRPGGVGGRRGAEGRVTGQEEGWGALHGAGGHLPSLPLTCFPSSLGTRCLVSGVLSNLPMTHAWASLALTSLPQFRWFRFALHLTRGRALTASDGRAFLKRSLFSFYQILPFPNHPIIVFPIPQFLCHSFPLLLCWFRSCRPP